MCIKEKFSIFAFIRYFYGAFDDSIVYTIVGTATKS